jgi:hypothetical protein
MERSFLLFAGLFFLWILVVAHGILLCFSLRCSCLMSTVRHRGCSDLQTTHPGASPKGAQWCSLVQFLRLGAE